MNDVLLEAAVNGDFDTVKSFMRDKGNPSLTDKYGLSPLMYAVWNGHSECTKMLLGKSLLAMVNFESFLSLNCNASQEDHKLMDFSVMPQFLVSIVLVTIVIDLYHYVRTISYVSFTILSYHR
jgi:ankyrin repeat protein